MSAVDVNFENGNDKKEKKSNKSLLQIYGIMVYMIYVHCLYVHTLTVHHVSMFVLDKTIILDGNRRRGGKIGENVA
jgi:hypothetical protein